MKKLREYIIYSLGILFILFIIVQHNFVYMYFDDYGYASLTYSWDGNSKGMDYGLHEIFSFLKFQYLNWGGRILYFFAEILAFKIGGLKCIQWIQCIIILSINFFSGKIVSLVFKCDAKKPICLMNIVYGLFTLRTVYDGIYWFTASVLYVWPLLPLLVGFYIMLKYGSENRLMNVITCICLFLAAFSQEQMAVLTIVSVVTYFLVVRIRGSIKYSRKYVIVTSICTMVGTCLCVLAPGNFKRADSQRYEEFYNMSFVRRIFSNLDDVIDINFGTYNYVFVILFSLIAGLFFYTVFKKILYTIVGYAFVLFFVLEKIVGFQNEIGMVVRIIWAGYFCVVLLVALWIKERNEMFAFVVAGGCSQGMMLISPSISERCHTMFEFILHIILVYIIISIDAECIGKKCISIINRCLIVIVSLYSIFNITYILNGYKNNYEINQINNYKLIETARNIRAGVPIEDVNLYRLNDDKFANIMGYDSLHSFIESWMKNYYELPSEIRFRWLTFGDTSNYQVIDGNWYDDGWLGDYAVMLFSGKQKTVTFSFNNIAEKDNMVIFIEYKNNKYEVEVPANETVTYTVELEEGDSEVRITPSENFSPENGDERLLSVIMGVQY